MSPVSLRLSKQTAEKVRAIAAVGHRSVAEPVKIQTEEALKVRAFPRIVVADGATGRRAVVLGGPDVWESIEPYLAGGKDWASLREAYPDLDEEVLRTVIRYYEAYPEEIEARLALNQAAWG